MLTAAQRKALEQLEAHQFHDGWMYAPSASQPTLAVLRRLSLVEFYHDGGRYTAHRITPAGRSALAEERRNDG